MRRDIVQSLQWPRRFVATGIAVVLVMLSPMMCLAGATEQSPEALCLLRMAQDSGDTSPKLDCCEAQSPANAALIGQTVMVAPPVLLAPVLGIASLPTAPSHVPGALEPGVPKISRTPTYLLVSLFRI
ncbi:MAG: hypothetical protein AB7L71_13470 [Vicinamibacterales bacterium]